MSLTKVKNTNADFQPPTIQKFTSGSGTYTTPANVKWIRVRMVGGGGAETGSAGTGGTGGTTTFGSSLLTCTGGDGGAGGVNGADGGAGGSAGVNGTAGAAGADGLIIVEEHYQ